jgi:hypothetical protein
MVMLFPSRERFGPFFGLKRVLKRPFHFSRISTFFVNSILFLWALPLRCAPCPPERNYEFESLDKNSKIGKNLAAGKRFL